MSRHSDGVPPDAGDDYYNPLEESLDSTLDGGDPLVDRQLRGLIGPVPILRAPAYGFERVVLKARRRRHRLMLMRGAGALVTTAAVACAVLVGVHIGAAQVPTAGCDTSTQIGLAAAYGDQSANGDAVKRKTETAIGGLLAAGALTAGIAAGCNSAAPHPSGNPSAGISASPTPGPTGPTTSPSASASTSATTSASASASSGVPECSTADLQATATVVAGSSGAGNEAMNVALTNTSGHSCYLAGYPGFKLEDVNQSGQATDVVRVDQGLEGYVTLQNGQSGAVTITFDPDVPGAGEPTSGPCEIASHYLEITPPNQNSQLVAQIGDGPVTVCQTGTLRVTPFVAGSTGPNQ